MIFVKYSHRTITVKRRESKNRRIEDNYRTVTINLYMCSRRMPSIEVGKSSTFRDSMCFRTPKEEGKLNLKKGRRFSDRNRRFDLMYFRTPKEDSCRIVAIGLGREYQRIKGMLTSIFDSIIVRR